MARQTLQDLGWRERQIMEIIYRRGHASAAEVRHGLADPPSYSAVRALLRILEAKGHLRHEQHGLRYLYSPTVPRDTVRRAALQQLVEGFFDGCPEEAIAALRELLPSPWADAGPGNTWVRLPAREATAIGDPAERLLRVCLLGRFEVWRAGELLRPPAWRRPKVAALFQWLCLQGGRRVSRGEAMEALWSDLPLARAPRNLATTLSMLRHALDGAAATCLFSTDETLQLALGEAVWVDVAAFEQHLSAAARLCRTDGAAAAAEHCRAALALYPGELLPDLPFADWVLPHRQRLAELRQTALVTLAEHLLARGDALEADALTRQALEQDPCEESALRVRMAALAHRGQRTEALRCFQQFCATLRRELQAEPEAATVRLYQRLRRATG